MAYQTEVPRSRWKVRLAGAAGSVATSNSIEPGSERS
jgi:hypothetical protein